MSERVTHGPGDERPPPEPTQVQCAVNLDVRKRFGDEVQGVVLDDSGTEIVGLVTTEGETADIAAHLTEAT
jgi:hypothetical protein